MKNAVKVPLKPLSVNEAWQGRRYKTEKYRRFVNSMLYLLPPSITLPDPPYEIIFYFGVSSTLADWDNPIKPAQDVIAKKYGFNDRLIKRGTVEIETVKKGNEYIEFEIRHFEGRCNRCCK